MQARKPRKPPIYYAGIVSGIVFLVYLVVIAYVAVAGKLSGDIGDAVISILFQVGLQVIGYGFLTVIVVEVFRWIRGR